jgi:hypothetical protein
MTDVGTQLRASVEAQYKALDLLRAGEQILVHGNVLYNDVHDLDAFLSAVTAVTQASRTLAEFIQIVRTHDVEA